MSWHLLCVGIFNILTSCGLIFSQLCTFTQSHLFFSHCCLCSICKDDAKVLICIHGNLQPVVLFNMNATIMLLSISLKKKKKHCIKLVHCASVHCVKLFSEFRLTNRTFQISSITKTTVKCGTFQMFSKSNETPQFHQMKLLSQLALGPSTVYTLVLILFEINA